MENEDKEIILGEVEELVDDNDSLQTTKPMVQAYDADGNLVSMNQVINYVPSFDTSGVAPFGLPKKIKIGGVDKDTGDFLIETYGFTPYYPGDDLTELRKLNTRQSVQDIQTKLEDAGYLKDGSFTKGLLDESTKKAFQTLLADANTAGQDWNITLSDVLTNPKYDTSELPDKLELDYANLTNQVMSTVKSVVGRTPTDNELDILTGILAGLQQEQFEGELSNAEIAAQPLYREEQIMFEGRPIKTGELQKVTPSGFADVPNAEVNFQNKVQELFKPEMDLNQRREQTTNVANVIKSSVAGLRSIGG